MDGRPYFGIRGTHSTRGPDETSSEPFAAIPVCFAVAGVMAKLPRNVTPGGKPRMPGVTHGS